MSCTDNHSHPHSHPHDAPSSLPLGRTPTRAILSKDDLERWMHSDTQSKFVAFIAALNDAAKNKKLGDDLHMGTAAVKVMGVLDTLEEWSRMIEPIKSTGSRFGNSAFIEWYDKMEQNAFSLVKEFVPSDEDAHEVSIYLVNSFGNRKRIDYGTGHEAHFIAFLYCLEKLGLVTEADFPALTLKVFWRYIGLMRVLQFQYWLEPAGSHGVWGLDDYHFLPFMFGSAQFFDHKYLKPKCIHDPEILQEFSKDYMYLSCIAFINSVKTESLRWHSPMLDDISGVKQWSKVNSGMMKMYLAEVLGKLPIMQHFLFGSFLPFEASGEMIGEEDELGCVHAMGQERPACCFIRVPSAIAAAAAKGQVGASAREFGLSGSGMVGGALGGMRPRPLPFD
ncbi:Serine/threonine-protein phosphatase 2A activator 2 [Chytriomyces hyalinus]|nr:Serine/threonine-protein phosphatase 2A activator 2 [Chytriomyces hyalinus]